MFDEEGVVVESCDEVPDWYRHLRACRWLGITPEQGLTTPRYWLTRALMADATEAEATELRNQDAMRPRGGA